MASPSAPMADAHYSVEPILDIVPDDDLDDVDGLSWLGDTDVASSNQSLANSVWNYQYENGRRYHSYREGEYLIPNDEREQERLDLHHHQFRIMLGGALFRAPFDPSSARILDLGTGTGIWAIDMADEYPNASITGVDLSPIQPNWVPSNCEFQVDDFESSWHFPHLFDFIHGRTLAGSVRDFPCLYQRIKENLTPDGWAEMVDFTCDVFSDDDTKRNAPSTFRWIELLNASSVIFGKDMNIASQHKQWMINAGFKNVQEVVYKIPLSPWAKHPKMKELGRYQQAIMLEAIESYSLALFTRVLGWGPEQLDDFFAAVRNEMMDLSLHLYTKFYFVYGQKGE